MNVARNPIYSGWSRDAESCERWKQRTPLHFQQYLPDYPILPLHGLQIVSIKIRVVLAEVFQPQIQLPENVVQSSDKICAVAAHPNSAKVLMHCGPYLIEVYLIGVHPIEAFIPESTPLGPGKKQV